MLLQRAIKFEFWMRFVTENWFFRDPKIKSIPKNRSNLEIKRHTKQKPNGEKTKTDDDWQVVVSTHLKNISQIGSFPQVGVKIKRLKPPPSWACEFLNKSKEQAFSDQIWGGMDEAENQGELFEQLVSIFFSHCLHQAAGLKRFLSSYLSTKQKQLYAWLWVHRCSSHISSSFKICFPENWALLPWPPSEQICVIEVTMVLFYLESMVISWNRIRKSRSSMLQYPKDNSCSKKVAF